MTERTRNWVLWAGLALIFVAFGIGVFSVLTIILAVEFWKALTFTLLCLFVLGAVMFRKDDAEPLKMNESVWLDVDGDKE